MKYPKEQFAVLTETLKVFKAVPELGDLTKIPALHLFGLCVDMHRDESKHNRIVRVGNTHKMLHSVRGEKYQYIIEPNKSIDLYPKGCNDSHIITAVKAALKEIYSLS